MPAVRAQVRSYRKSGHALLGSIGSGGDGFRMENPPGHRALRKGRTSLARQVYFLTTITAGRVPWFLDVELARTASRLMVEEETWGDARLLCWVLMPDHWHGLVELGERDGLSLVVNRFKSIISRHLHRAGQSCNVWSPGFHDRALRRDESVHQAARYIVANPMRAGLVDQVNDYPYWDCVWLNV